MAQRRKLVAGNWKLNGSLSLVSLFEKGLDNVNLPNVDVVICPPAVYYRHLSQDPY